MPKTLITLESAEAMMHFKPKTVVAKIAPRAAMWIGGDLDTLVPNEQSMTMYKNAGEPKNLLLLKNVEHHSLYSGKPFEQMLIASTDWFDAYLKKA